MYYTYYSYETDKGINGLGYIGYRKCPENTTPEEDDYFGTPSSPRNKDFKENKNKAKIILGRFETQKEAIDHEIYLHEIWDVKNNPHFANVVNQVSNGFCISGHTQQSKERISKTRRGKPISEKTKQKLSELNTGENNKFYGKTHTKKVKKRLSDLAKKRTADKNNRYDRDICVWINESLKLCECITAYDLCKKYNLNRSAITSLKLGKLERFKGWTYEGLF